MGVLCDTQIRELVGIEPFETNGKRPGRVSFGVSSYGYDVRVGSVFKVFTNVAPHGGQAIVDPKNFTGDMFISIDTRETGLEDPSLMQLHQRLAPYVSDPWSFKLFRNFMAQVALRQSPELKQIDAALAAQQRLLQSTNRSFWIPQFGLRGEVSQLVRQWGAGEGGRAPLGLDDTDWNLSVGGTLPLLEGGGRVSRRSRIHEEILRLRIERQALAQRIEQGLRASLHAAGAARAAITLSRQAADASQENLELVTDSYSRGITDILGLLDAQNAALLAEIKASNAIHDYLLQWMDVERALGRFTFTATAQELDSFFAELDSWFARETSR